jgi:hypothetical protein
LKIPSALDVGLGSISAWRRFVVPTTFLVFVRNARSFSWNDLLLRYAICRFASQVVGREGFGEHPIDLIGPTTVMFDNLIGNLRAKARHRCAYLPFGAGPRICIGMSFAMLEMVVLLATFVRGFRFKTTPGHCVALVTNLTLRAKNGLPLPIDPV